MSRYRIGDARLTWRTLAIVTAGVIAVMALAFFFPSKTMAAVWIGLVAFFGLGLMAKMGENDTRQRLAEAPPGAKLPWWVSKRSLAFPWWAGWLASSGVVAATYATFVAASGVWAITVYVIGLGLVWLLRRRVIRGACPTKTTQ